MSEYSRKNNNFTVYQILDKNVNIPTKHSVIKTNQFDWIIKYDDGGIEVFTNEEFLDKFEKN